MIVVMVAVVAPGAVPSRTTLSNRHCDLYNGLIFLLGHFELHNGLTSFSDIFQLEFFSYGGELTFFLGLQVKQKNDGIFISQDKYVAEILKKFRFIEVKTASTQMETQKPLLKDEDGKEVDVYLYRYQANPKVSHLHAMKGFLAYTDSDYVGASLDRKSTTGGCQFLGCRLISWRCKEETVSFVVAKFMYTEAEYVAASSCFSKCFGFRINYLIMGAFGLADSPQKGAFGLREAPRGAFGVAVSYKGVFG
ncbi:hypothetical protein Tco_0335930 [Tanacetum coccineum]